METHYKNQRQVEFAELVEVMRAKGVRPAGVARLLKISKASVSKILDGKQIPRDSTLDLLRRIVDEQSGSITYPRAAEGLIMRDEYAIKLRNLPDEHQRTVEKIIDQLDGVSSTVASIAAKSRAAASALARQPGPKSPPSPPTGAPISYKRDPARGTARRPKNPPVPPGQAPT